MMMMMMMIFALLLFQIQCQCLLLCGVLSAFYSLPPFQLFSPFWLPVSCQCTASLSFYFSGVSVRLHCTAVCLCVLYSSVRRPSQCQSVSDMRSVTPLPMLSSLKFSLTFSFIASITRQLCTAADDHLPARRCCLRTTTLTTTEKVHTCFFSRFLCFSGGEVFPLFFAFRSALFSRLNISTAHAVCWMFV